MARSTMALPFASYPVIASVTALGNIAANFLKFSSALFAVCILNLSIRLVLLNLM